MSDFGVVIRDGMIVDETGAPRYRNDLVIRDGRIVEIGKIDASRADRHVVGNTACWRVKSSEKVGVRK
jgi:N-acyl-D-aspartate/D-glutamate deacylase